MDELMRACRVPLLWGLVALLALITPAYARQLPAVTPTPAAAPAPAAQAVEPPPPEAPDSPRASVRTFFDLAMKKGDFARAARYLVLPADDARRGPELASRLRAVIEQHAAVNLDSLSPLSTGQPDDGLPHDVDQVGSVPGASGERRAPIYIVRRADRDGAFWAFSRETVAQVDGWYDALPDRWVRDWMPASLQRHGPLGLLLWWQWIAFPVLVLAAWGAGRLLGHTLALLLRHLFARTSTDWDDRLLGRTEPALRLLVAIATAALLVPLLALLPTASRWVGHLLSAAATVAVFWGIWLSVDVWRLFLLSRPWAADSPSAKSLLSVALNFVRVVVAIAGILAVLAVLGYPVSTIVAGLGIGGIALAFGAQKTIENLFGSVSLAIDQPFRVGDFVKIEDFTGNVERIGMRSTQIRTLDRTVVTLPNGKLSEMRIEGFGTRDRIRFATMVGLAYGTTEAQMRQVVIEIQRLLGSTPEVWPDTIVAQFAALSASSLDIEVMCWIQTSDVDVFRRIRADLLLGILRIVEGAGTSVAFPTRTLHIADGNVPIRTTRTP